MIIDHFYYFAGGADEGDADQSIAATGTTAFATTNIKDNGTGGQDIGTGENLYAVCLVTSKLPDTTATKGTPTLTVKLVAAANAALTSGASTETLGTFAMGTTGTTVEGAAAGSFLYSRVDPGFGDGKRYVGGTFAQSAIAGTMETAGRVQFFLTKDIRKWEAKANATNAAVAIT